MGFFSTLGGAAIGGADAQQAMQLLKLKLQQQAVENDRAQQELDLRKQEGAARMAGEQQNRDVGLLQLQGAGSDVSQSQPAQDAAGRLGIALQPQAATPAVAATLPSTQIGQSTPPPQSPTGAPGFLDTGAPNLGAPIKTAMPGNLAQDAQPAKLIYPGTRAEQLPAQQIAREREFGDFLAANPGATPQQLVAAGIRAGLTAKDVKDLVDAEHPMPTTAMLDTAAQNLYAKRAGGQPLTPAESATLTGYEDRKRVVSDPAQLAASERQTKSQNAALDRQSISQAAQTAQQKRAQDFTEAQSARKEISEKVEQPYLDAQEKMNTLRNAIDLAQHGNMVAGSLTPLLATLGVVTSEGVKRINATEVQQVQGAGSLIDSLKGRWGKVTSGQPMDPALQGDTLKLADMLEANARKKYLTGLQATKTRYKDNPIIASEQPLPGAERRDTAPPDDNSPLSILRKRKAGQ